MAISRRFSRRGSALLTVLWISAALAAIAFALANTVRGETERTATTVDELRAYYLAAGAIDRAAIEVLWSTVATNDPKIARFSTSTDYDFLTGKVHVEFLPETGKMDVNRITPEQLARLLEALGASPERISGIVQGVIGWREGRGSSFSSLGESTFPGAATSFQEIEEMLAVKGVTPELFYGTYAPVGDGAAGGPRLVRHAGLVDCLGVFGSHDQVDANTADPAVLHALGMPDSGIQALVDLRSRTPLDPGKLNDLMPLLGPAGPLLRLEGHSILTIRATAMVKLPSGGYSDLKRTVAAMVKYMPQGYDSPIHILRWYDNAWSN
ncbi:MAG: general secretion pathway protein GspK [Acidobacteria bacterium]|nr:general secretion pathway protein GspK [Acidobacteriota bacterium]